MTSLFGGTVLKTRDEQSEESTALYLKTKEDCMKYFDSWSESDQTDFVEYLLSKMSHCQHSQINCYLKPMLQRDFISLLPSEWSFIPLTLSVKFQINVVLTPEKGLDHVAETVLSYLDAKSLCSAELVCKEWYRVISEGMLWKKLIESRVRTDTLWRGLAHRRGWYELRVAID